MQFRLAKGSPLEATSGALVVPVFAGASVEGVAHDADAATGGAIADALETGEFKGKLGEVLMVHATSRSFRRVLAVGLGESKAFEPSVLARYAAVAVRHLGRKNVRELTIVPPPQVRGNEVAAGSFIAEGSLAGAFETTTYQSAPERRNAIETVAVSAPDFDTEALQRGLDRGAALGEAINLARRLALTPANDMTPSVLAREATAVAKDADLDIEILDEERARAEGMGSFLSVAQGSVQPPKFIVLRYQGDPSSNELLALVGKGITFDSGGISIKPADRMEEMKYDMSGGAGVIAAMSAIGKLKPKINVVGIVPATENMPGGKATKPGDIVKASNGKTIEVINTDAEGRLILADGLCYANKLGATRIVDVATLTGAVVIALGHAAAAVISNDDAFAERFLEVAQATGERFWRMPYYEDYLTQMKSDIADLKNTGGRPAGTLTAAAFLREFVDGTPWIHLDIAGTAYLDGESAWQAKGPTGIPVRTFVALAETLAGSPVIAATNGAAKLEPAGT